MNRTLHLVIRAAALFALLSPAAAVAQAAQQTPPPADALDLPATAGAVAGSVPARLHRAFDGRAGDEPMRAPGYDWMAAPAPRPQWQGLIADGGYFLAWQTAVVGLLYLMPESVSGWSDQDKNEFSFGEWRDNVSNPHRDSDTHFINYVLHPYWGAAYYVRGQQRGLDRSSSFWFSALLSTLFEFGLEALFEQPSYQDLWVTPIAGSLIGEWVFMPLRERIRARSGPLDWTDKLLLAITDPLGVAGAESDRLLGVRTDIHLALFDPARAAGTGNPSAAAPAHPGWGLQLRVRW